MAGVRIDPQVVARVKRILLEFGSPIIPISAVFQVLGYTGVNGVEWGLLVGSITTVAIEAGYEVVKLGPIFVIKKPNREVKPAASDNDMKASANKSCNK